MKSKKPVKNAFFPVIAVFFLLISCDLPPAAGNKGVLAVILPGVSSSAPVSDARSILSDELFGFMDNVQMQYRIDCTGPGKTQSVNARPGQVTTIYLEPGRWRIAVTAQYPTPKDTSPEPGGGALYDWRLVGNGVTSVEIFPGQENRVQIPLSLSDDFFAPSIAGNEWLTVYDNAGFDEPCYFEVVDYDADWLFIPGFEPSYQWYYSAKNSNRGGLALEDGDLVDGAASSGLEIRYGLFETTTYLYCEVTYSFDDADTDAEPFTRRTKPWGVYSPDFAGLKNKINDNNDPYGVTISLPQHVDFYITETITVNKNLILRGCMSSFYRGLIDDKLFTGEMFTVTNGTLWLEAEGSDGTLVLYGVPDDGLENVYSLTGPLIRVGRNGTLEMNVSVRLYYNWAANGGAVYVGAGGTFYMYGGDIYGNKADSNGGAVYVSSGGFFSMDSGEICGNTAGGKGGGVYIASGGSLNKFGYSQECGTITGSDETLSPNTAGGNQSGHAVFFAGSNWWRDKTVTNIIDLSTDSSTGWND